MPTILTMGREAKPEEQTRSSQAMRKLAEANGWTAAIGYSKFQDDPRTFKTGAKAGTTIEGKIVDNVWCQGFREGHIFTVTWQDNKLNHCLYDNRIITLNELKEKLK